MDGFTATPTWSTIQPVNPLDTMTRDEVLMKWEETKKVLETAKEAEMSMRKYVVSRAFPNATEGVNKVDLGAGYELKASVKFNYKLDTDIDKVSAVHDEISSIGNSGSFIAERLFKWSADLVLKEYRALCEPNATDEEKQIKKLLEKVLTVTEGAPTLKIKAPKEKK